MIFNFNRKNHLLYAITEFLSNMKYISEIKK